MRPIMSDWLRWRARATPHKLAVLSGGRLVSYAELERLADRLAAGLTARGVQAGDRVAMSLGNSLEAIALIHAVARVRAVLVPLNTRLTAAERGRQIDMVEPTLLAVDKEPTAEDEGEAKGELQPATGAASASKTAAIVTLTKLTQDAAHIQRVDSDRCSPPSPRSGSQPQSIIFTSGTTGAPKGVVLTFDNHFWSANASAYRLGLDTGDRWLSCLPLYHVGGLSVVFRSCLYGTAIVLQRGFDLEAFQRSLREDGVTLTSLVPTMLHRLLHSLPGAAWSGAALRMILLGGAAATPELLDAAAKAGVPVATTYGLTEAASQVATALPTDAQRKPASVGRPLMFTELRIVDRDGSRLPPGKIGELLVRGPQVMAAYYGNPDATASALQDGWLRTGDMGYLDSDGDLFVVQRRKDMIVSGGENIYPAEVEAVLRAHPAVADACVVGLRDAEWGQRCAAAVQLHAGQGLSREDLLAYSRTRLAGYKQPSAQHIRFVDALPQTVSGKIARRDVEMLFADGATSESGIVAPSDSDFSSDLEGL